MLKRVHLRRLRKLYRSAGWPSLDAIEIDLLAAGMIERVLPAGRPEYLRLTDAGIQALAVNREQNQSALDAHEALVQQVAQYLIDQGRIVYVGLGLLSKPGAQWQHPRPDVFSIRRTSQEAYLEPMIHEIKVKRADLLADLRKPEKHQAYLAAAGCCSYVLAEGIGTADDVPATCGVMMAGGDGLTALRPAPAAADFRLGFPTWMTLAKATPFRLEREGGTAQLGEGLDPED